MPSLLCLTALLALLVILSGPCLAAGPGEAEKLARELLPEPQQLTLAEGVFELPAGWATLAAPGGPEHEGCRAVLGEALKAAGLSLRWRKTDRMGFVVGRPGPLPELPNAGHAEEGYVIAVTPEGVTARGASPAGVLHAAQTLRQLLRLGAASRRLPCLSIVDYPQFRLRGIYIEGGQERFGRIVAGDYLREQIRRLSEFKLNTLILECYNLLPFASFGGCADEGTLSEKDCRALAAEARRYHITIIPSLQTLAQAYELVWANEQGAPYREITAPGMMCPSNPAIYPFIKGLYRDLLTWFPDTPMIGVGCSEIDMQWQGHYCPACRKRVDAGETVRDLLVGHAQRCIQAVHELSAELGRTVRPLMWADEFTMYGPGKDWVGIERIPKDTVMGYWKYWPEYGPSIRGLLTRGYDVVGLSAMYNHTFYLADLSPEDPPKSWPAMEQTGTVNITGLVAEGARAQRDCPQATFWGAGTASFSKHRLRAFDSIWYGFALNAQAGWSHPERPLAQTQPAFTAAFTRAYYDARTDAAAAALAETFQLLDRGKSRLERANQTLHDAVGVYDTQEAGYQDNTLTDAFRRCAALTNPGGKPQPALAAIRDAAALTGREATEAKALLDSLRPSVGRTRELGELWLAAEKIAAHAEREALMIRIQEALKSAPGKPAAEVQRRMQAEAQSWSAHRRRMEEIMRRSRRLSSRGDPLGLRSLLADIRSLEAHLEALAATGRPPESAGAPPPADLLLQEPFTSLDPARWIVLGEPKLRDGKLETRAPGGWDRYCGVATRQAFTLDDRRPLNVEFDLTPVEMGIDSQLFATSDAAGRISYRLSFYGPRDRFGIYTLAAGGLKGTWLQEDAGWRQRAVSAAVQVGKTYRVRAQITRRSFRIVVRELGADPWQPPLWDTGPAPMDELERASLLFADVEPPGGKAASRWGEIRIWRG